MRTLPTHSRGRLKAAPKPHRITMTEDSSVTHESSPATTLPTSSPATTLPTSSPATTLPNDRSATCMASSPTALRLRSVRPCARCAYSMPSRCLVVGQTGTWPWSRRPRLSAQHCSHVRKRQGRSTCSSCIGALPAEICTTSRSKRGRADLSLSSCTSTSLESAFAMLRMRQSIHCVVECSAGCPVATQPTCICATCCELYLLNVEPVLVSKIKSYRVPCSCVLLQYHGNLDQK